MNHRGALWALVPVKPLGEGKSRLASLLGPEERAALSLSLLRRTLTVLVEAGCFDGVVVVSRDATVLELAATQGALPLAEVGAGLNGALRQARAEAMRRGAEAVLVLPADVPGVSCEELRAVAEMCDGSPGIVIAPSATGGTNLLMVQPPSALRFAYGAGSFDRHVRQAEQCGLCVHVVRSATLAFDIDLPGDLDHVLAEPHRNEATTGAAAATYRNS